MTYIQCLSYLLRHKYYVWFFGRLLGINPWRLFFHDWTKLFPVQLYGYANYFHTKNIKTESFYRAIHDHFRREPHHWNYWVVFLDNGDPEKEFSVVCLPMPDIYIREMVADWAAAGFTKKGVFDLESYYHEKRDQMLLHAETRIKAEAYIEKLKHDSRIKQLSRSL